MRLEFHPAVAADFSDAFDYYEAEGGLHLAERFEGEVSGCLDAIKAGPTQFPFFQGKRDVRRIRLKSFPYVIVYRASPVAVRVFILKHERRHPRFGSKRR